MKIALFVAAAVVLAVSLFADYKGRSWMAARKRERNEQQRR